MLYVKKNNVQDTKQQHQIDPEFRMIQLLKYFQKIL